MISVLRKNNILCRCFSYKGLIFEDLDKKFTENKYGLYHFPHKYKELIGQKENEKSLIDLSSEDPPWLPGERFKFVDETISCSLFPKLMETNSISVVSKDRAKTILSSLEYGAIGAYTHSRGIELIRQTISNFLKKRDGFESNLNDIYLTHGVSEGLSTILPLILKDPNDAVMIPDPCRPLISSQIKLNQGSGVRYNLKFENGFSIDINQIEEAYYNASKQNKNIKGIIISNPIYPCGKILNDGSIKDLLRFADKQKLLVLVDESFSFAIFNNNPQFKSARKVLHELKDLANKTEMFTFLSCSNPLHSQYSLRSGIILTSNLQEYVTEQIYKLRSICLCSNSVSQIAMNLFLDPPESKENNDEIVDQFENEIKFRQTQMQKGAELMYNYLNKCRGFECHTIESGIFAFPRIQIPNRIKKVSQELHISSEEAYCLEALKKGILLAPGNVFSERNDEHFLRVTNSLYSNQPNLFEKSLERLVQFNDSLY